MKRILSGTSGSSFGIIFWIAALMSPFVCSAAQGPEVSIITDRAPGEAVMHGLNKLTDALLARNIAFEKVFSENDAKGRWVITTGLSTGEGGAARMLKAGNHVVPAVREALVIWKTTLKNKPAWIISGFDDRGVMYGLLDVAKRIATSSEGKPMAEVRDITEQPYVSERAISIFTMNRAYWESRFYDEAYWRRYLDMLAENRFNSLVVVFGYENGGFLAPPYPYFFDVEEFPGVRMVGISPEEQQRNVKALNDLIAMHTAEASASLRGSGITFTEAGYRVAAYRVPETRRVNPRLVLCGASTPTT